MSYAFFSMSLHRPAALARSCWPATQMDSERWINSSKFGPMWRFSAGSGLDVGLARISRDVPHVLRDGFSLVQVSRWSRQERSRSSVPYLRGAISHTHHSHITATHWFKSKPKESRKSDVWGPPGPLVSETFRHTRRG